MGDWTQVGENLVRHRSGKIYLRAKIGGKIKRVSLKVSDLRIAKLKRDDHLETLRKAVKATHKDGAVVRTVGDAVEAVAARMAAQPQLSQRTVSYYAEMCGILRKTLPLASHGRTWTATEAAAWWKTIARKYSPQRANNILAMARRVGALLVERGLRVDDPTSKLKRMGIHAKELVIPSRETIDAIIADIRAQKKAHSEEAANYVAFLAYSGCRHRQARAFEWKHVVEDWITFPGGIEGSKGARLRRLPMNPPLRALLESMRPAKAKGRIFYMDRPREALTNACARLKVPHLRVHDLRHFFASFALESGVDVPTVSRWLGHKDGGVLVLRTYGHVRDDHSLASAEKLK